MIKRRNQLLGASAIVLGLWAPFAVQAHDNDDAWLYVAGAVAAYAHFNNHAYDYAYKHRDYHYTKKHQRKHQRKHQGLALRHHDRAHRHQRYMHRVHDRRNHGNYRNNG